MLGMVRRHGFAATALTALAVHAPAARAQDAQTQAMGRALFNEGMTLFTEGRYFEACPKFEASLRHYPGLGTRGKLAECFEKVGKYASAWTAYRDVAELAARLSDAAREQIAKDRAKALESRLSYVTVVVPPANDAAGLVIRCNGRELDRGKLGTADPVDAGTNAFEVAAPGRKPFIAQVTVIQGQSARFEVPSLDAMATTSAATADSIPAKGRDRDASTWQKPTGLVLTAVGIGSIGIGAYFGLRAGSVYDGAFDDGSCNRTTKGCNASGQSRVDDARSKATLATVLLAAGGAVTVGGVVLFLTAPAARRTGLRIAPAAYVGGGGIMLGGTL